MYFKQIGRKLKCLAIATGMVALCALLTGCPFGDSSKEAGEVDSQSNIVIAKPMSSTSHLYYSGSIMPLVTTNALSPVDGRISELLFKYGDKIKKGQTLAIINSTQLADDYHQTVNAYLEKKDAMQHQSFLFPGTEKLYQAGVTSKYEYMQGKSALESSRLEFLQAKYELEKVLKKAGIDSALIEKLTLAETSEVTNILKKEFSHIPVIAQSEGVALFPTNAGSFNQLGGGESQADSADADISVGGEVKTGQLILAIGNQQGFSTSIKVNEVDVNRLKVKMPVVVTGDAFPDITLKGYIQSIASQAQVDQSGNSNIGQFDVVIAMPNIPAAAHQMIDVGMSCKVDIPITNASSIMLPIQAVWKKDNQHFVTIIDAETQRRMAIPVTTGHTTPTSVAILTGIQKGDKVIVNDRTQ